MSDNEDNEDQIVDEEDEENQVIDDDEEEEDGDENEAPAKVGNKNKAEDTKNVTNPTKNNGNPPQNDKNQQLNNNNEIENDGQEDKEGDQNRDNEGAGEEGNEESENGEEENQGDKGKSNEEGEEEGEGDREDQNEETPMDEQREIKDPNVQQLMNLDIETTNKDDIINLLMKKELIKQPKKKDDNNDYEDEKNDENNEEICETKKTMGTKKQGYKKENPAYKNVVSSLGAYIKEKSNNKPKDRFHKFLNEEEYGNPEFMENFNFATHHLTESINQNNFEEGNQEMDPEIKKLLFSDNLTKSPKKNVKYEITGKEISDKVSQALSHKQEVIEKIMNKCNEEYNEKHTFMPTINQTGNDQKRGLAEFLAEQDSHLAKIKKKNEDNKKKELERNLKQTQNKPQIDKRSEQMFKKINKSEEPCYERLFNKKYQTEKKNLLQEKEKERMKIQEDKKKAAEKKKKKTINLNQGKNDSPDKANKDNADQSKKEPVLHIPSPPKKKIKKEEPKKVYLLQNKDLKNQQFLYNNFTQKFKKVIDDYFAVLSNSQNQQSLPQNENNENEGGQENQAPVNNNENTNNNNQEQMKQKKLTYDQMREVLFNLNMCSCPTNPKQSEEEVAESTNIKEENATVEEMWNILKNPNETVDVEHLKYFLIAVVGLSNYQLFNDFKNNPDLKNFAMEIDNDKPNKEKEEKPNKEKEEKLKDEKLEKKLNKQIEELQKSVAKEDIRNRNNKYVNYDSNNNIIILPPGAKLIKSKFNLLNVNMISNKKVDKKKEKDVQANPEESFHPTINKNSKKIYEKYKDKMMQDTLGTNESKKDTNPNLDYIERLNKQREKRNMEIQKKIEENIKNEMKECTFKPKLDNKFKLSKEAGANRFNELYSKGKNKLMRKNKEKQDVDIEKDKEEYTFKPNLYKESIPENTAFENDIYNEKSYLMFYDRIKNGQKERKIRDACQERYEFDDNLQEYIKKNKMKEYIMQTGTPEESEGMNNNENNENSNMNATNHNMGYDKPNENSNEPDKKEDENQNAGGDNKNNYNSNDSNKNNNDEGEDAELEKKEGIPMLIIDVNIREGVKKKIYVYEGDTPEGLAEKFAKEHNLEPQTKEKLQNLIHNHMLRLLTRIDEENQSLSEKSGTTHMNKNQS